MVIGLQLKRGEIVSVTSQSQRMSSEPFHRGTLPLVFRPNVKGLRYVRVARKLLGTYSYMIQEPIDVFLPRGFGVRVGRYYTLITLTRHGRSSSLTDGN